MTAVLFTYYRASKDFSRQVHEDWKEVRKPLNVLRDEIAKKYSVDGFMQRGNRAYGLCVSVADDESVEPRRGLLLDYQAGRDGERFAVFCPDRRFKEGKALDKELAEFNEQAESAPDFRTYVVRRFSLGTFVTGEGERGGVPYFETGSGLAKGVIVLQIPHGGPNGSELPDVPGDFAVMPKSEFVKLTEE